MVINNNISVVTGGPGVGKTTILRHVLALLDGKSVALVAPTGKAAKRMAELTGKAASTIHRFLVPQVNNGVLSFSHHSENPVPHHHVLIDESSMLDAELAGWLFESIAPSRTSVTLIGDVNQLPSVGAGYVLGDMIDSGVVPVARLTEVHRAAQGSWVCTNAPKILVGDIDLTLRPDFKFHVRTDRDVLLAAVAKLVAKTMPDAGVRNIQLLTPQNGGNLGVHSLNRELQPMMNPARSGLGAGDVFRVFADSEEITYDVRAGDRVIQISNDYDRMVFNGEIGRVTSISPPNGSNGKRIYVDFSLKVNEARSILYDEKSARDSLRLAYALTIHKSQGSEWDWIVLVCHSSHQYMWTRQLLYTAVTRAKKGVVIVGDQDGIHHALDKTEPRRSTALRGFLERGLQ
jgi:exodeoxyribonuclease V alpha subunit